MRGGSLNYPPGFRIAEQAKVIIDDPQRGSNVEHNQQFGIAFVAVPVFVLSVATSVAGLLPRLSRECSRRICLPCPRFCCAFADAAAHSRCCCYCSAAIAVIVAVFVAGLSIVLVVVLVLVRYHCI